jgi:hypothetical protein
MTQTPKEKAYELYEIYAKALFEGTFVKKAKIKQCALIAVEEILEVGSVEIVNQYFDDRYWQEVKEEVNKL